MSNVKQVIDTRQRNYEREVSKISPISPGYKPIPDSIAVGDLVFSRQPEFGHSLTGDRVVEIRDYQIFIGQEGGSTLGGNRAWLMVEESHGFFDYWTTDELEEECQRLQGIHPENTHVSLVGWTAGEQYEEMVGELRRRGIEF